MKIAEITAIKQTLIVKITVFPFFFSKKFGFLTNNHYLCTRKQMSPRHLSDL